MEKILLQGTTEQIEQIRKNTILKDDYPSVVDNAVLDIWYPEDIQNTFNCTELQAKELLLKLFEDEGYISDAFDRIDILAKELGYDQL